jgi:type IV pilus assembly protein PilQ
MGSLLPLAAAVLAAAPVLAAADAPPAARPAASAEAKISVDFKDVDVVDVVRLLADVGHFQVVVDPGITCKLTLKLHEVPWDTTLDMALRVCGLASESDNGIVRVAPIAKLTGENEARRKLAEEQRLDRPLHTRRYTLSYARAAELAPLIKKFLSPRGDVVFDARTNTLIITDID